MSFCRMNCLSIVVTALALMADRLELKFICDSFLVL